MCVSVCIYWLIGISVQTHVNRICAMSLRSLLVWNCLKFASDHSWKVPSHYTPRLRVYKILTLSNCMNTTSCTRTRAELCMRLIALTSLSTPHPAAHAVGGSPHQTHVFMCLIGGDLTTVPGDECVWVGGLLQSVYCAVQFIRFYVYACDSLPGTMCDMITVTPAVETVSMVKWGGVGNGWKAHTKR